MAASVTDTAVVNVNDVRTLIANDVIIFFINGKPALINGARKLNNHPF